MQWIAPSGTDPDAGTLEKRLWAAADQLRANSGLTAQQYSAPVLGLIFLRFAEVRFAKRRAELETAGASAAAASRVDDPTAYHAESVLYLPETARFGSLLQLPEARRTSARPSTRPCAEIERAQPAARRRAAARPYQLFSSTLLKELLKKVSEIPSNVEYDAFGRIYEYFLGEFARTEGQKGGEFYTPASIVQAASSRSSSPTTAASSTPRAARAACSCSRRAFVAGASKNPDDELSHPRRREDRRDGPPLPHEPRRARAGRRHPPRRPDQQLLRRPARGDGTLRLRARQSAVQRERGRQGATEGRRRPGPPLSLRPAAHRQRELPLDPALLLGAERQGARGVRDGELRVRRPRLGAGNPPPARSRRARWT